MDGSTWLNVNATPLDHPQYGLVISYEDISDKRAAEARLNLAASVFTHAREGITITDKNGLIIDVNRGFTLITGYERDEVIGKTRTFSAQASAKGILQYHVENPVRERALDR